MRMQLHSLTAAVHNHVEQVTVVLERLQPLLQSGVGLCTRGIAGRHMLSQCSLGAGRVERGGALAVAWEGERERERGESHLMLKAYFGPAE